MKEHNNIEFDEIFRQQLENASAPVPNGVWEGISTSAANVSGLASAAVNSAIWMKAAIAVSVIGLVSFVTYEVISKKGSESIPQEPVIFEKTTQPVGELPGDTQDKITDQSTDDGSTVLKHEGNKVIAVKSHKNTQVKEQALQAQEPVVMKFFEIKDEISMDYVKKMNDNVVPGFDSSRTAWTEDEEKTEIPYIPEMVSVAYHVDSSFIYIPNVVTPNGDGVNDEYQIDIKGEEYVQITIYNGKSVRIFETKNKNTAWDCRMPNGELAPEGNYIVKVVYKFKNKSQATATTRLKLIK